MKVISTKKLEWKAAPKIGSLDHSFKGGEKKHGKGHKGEPKEGKLADGQEIESRAALSHYEGAHWLSSCHSIECVPFVHRKRSLPAQGTFSGFGIEFKAQLSLGFVLFRISEDRFLGDFRVSNSNASRLTFKKSAMHQCLPKLEKPFLPKLAASRFSSPMQAFTQDIKS
ncbi:hypothetical protein CEXT_654991 [Caerostris extrusa]|uniref:Uncharacterized protein n=1 Tax=Caerostris extrusa TaxID=172846 RepID=A0AAV4M954_CAEEX|nr:hypothetical protein CEXT_654991 [Caerostris extrusa]